MKYFTLESAQALIPDMQNIFERALEIQSKAEAKAKTVEQLDSQDQDPASLAIERGQLQFLVSAVNDCLQQIVDLGALPKGLDPALVDFPFRLEDEEVYLCWKLGEKKITHYHSMNSGFGGRQPLPAKKKTGAS